MLPQGKVYNLIIAVEVGIDVEGVQRLQNQSFWRVVFLGKRGVESGKNVRNQ